jgi:Ca2+-binding EF-hand superfamily protein
MRIAIAGIAWLTVLACFTLLGQEATRPTADASLAGRFKQYDKNGDGKVTREEAAQLPMFGQWDANKDGVVTLEEVNAFYAKTRATGRETNSGSATARTAGQAAGAPVSRPGFIPDVPFVGQINGSYGDPEFSQAASQVVFQDSQNRLWIGDIDSETGMFRAATGCDYLMDEKITLIFDRPPQGRKFSTNGPEWTQDDMGPCVVYTKEDAAGIMQQWMARLAGGQPVVTQLTHNKLDSYGNMPSRFVDGKPPRIAFTYDWPIWNAKAAWVFADKPEELHPVPGFDYNKMSMWSAVSADFLFVHRPPGATHGQIGCADADTGQVTVLTNDEGDKDDPGMFRAPEFGGEILLVCNVGNSALGIYRDLKSPDGFWTRVATLTLPADAPFRFISSPETIAPATGIGGVSYFSLLAREGKDRNTPGSIWVLGLGKDPSRRLARRIDDGALTGARTSVLEPEPFVGRNEAYVYYNYYDFAGGRWGLRRASTGIKVATASRPVRKTEAPAAPAETGRPMSVAQELAKPSLEVCLIASSAERATKFFVDGIGLAALGEPLVGGGGPGMKMLLFSAGSSNVKVRVYSQPPAKLPTEITARNGLRVLTIPVERLDDIVARLKRLGFAVTDVKQTGETHWVLARNADGTAFELVEVKPGAARELEIGLVVPDLAKAREFFTGVYGAQELPEATSRVLPGERELRFTTGATVFKCWAPKGDRASDTGQVPDVLGFRYVTHNVSDAQALHNEFTARGVELAQPLSNFQGLASLFMARGPGGAILEFVCPTVAGASGAGAARPAATGQIPQQVQDLFKRFDRNSDGKLSPSEMPNAEKFKQMDANGDGVVTLEEAARSFGQGGGAGGPARAVTGKEPEAHPPADRAFLDFKFATDYFAGSQPPDSALAKATEANALVAHEGKLYCAVSYMPESKRPEDVNPKVLVKKSANGPWEVDLDAGPEFMRLGMIQSVTFTTDGRGHKLSKSVSVLIAGTGAWQQQPTGVVVFSLNDTTGKWAKSVLSPNRWNREKTNHETEVRTIWDHVDRVTGVHYVFAGAGTGRIYRGVYDPAQPGLINWDAKPELDDLVGRFTCAAEANGVQYAGVAYGATKEGFRGITERPVKDHGLFRRVDGPQAHWEWVPIKEWEDPNEPGRSLHIAQIRGLAAVPAPDGRGEVLLCAWDAQDGLIERSDPRADFKVTTELNVHDFFQKAWGRRVGISTFAYNDMLPVIHPATGEKAHLIGLWLMHPDGEGNELGKSSWYLVRYADGTYRYQRIWDEKNALTGAKYGLRGCRSIRPSPFPEEAGRVWYFCGFDQFGAQGAGATGPTAWIYRGLLPESPCRGCAAVHWKQKL